MAIRNALQCNRLTMAGWIVLVSGGSGNTVLDSSAATKRCYSLSSCHIICIKLSVVFIITSIY